MHMEKNRGREKEVMRDIEYVTDIFEWQTIKFNELNLDTMF